jgi:hypothetical protein
MKSILIFLAITAAASLSHAVTNEIRDYVLQTNSSSLQTLEAKTNILLADSSSGGISELNIETFEINTEKKSLEVILKEMDNRRCWGECSLLTRVQLKIYPWEEPSIAFYDYITEENPTFTKQLNEILRRGTERGQKAYHYQNGYHDGSTYSETFVVIVLKGEENIHEAYRVSFQQGK